jgi:hypothetical protein
MHRLQNDIVNNQMGINQKQQEEENNQIKKLERIGYQEQLIVGTRITNAGAAQREK